jgi:hypothetical protein
MSTPIDGISSVTPSATPSPELPAIHQTHHTHQPVPAAPPHVNSPNDTVTLSQTAQVNQLNGLGESVSLIAQTLGVPVAVVDLDLGIVATQTASTQTASTPAVVPVALNRSA